MKDRRRWVLSEIAEELRRRTDDEMLVNPKRKVQEPIRREHEKRSPPTQEKRRQVQRGEWFKGDTEWYAAVVPLITW